MKKSGAEAPQILLFFSPRETRLRFLLIVIQ